MDNIIFDDYSDDELFDFVTKIVACRNINLREIKRSLKEEFDETQIVEKIDREGTEWTHKWGYIKNYFTFTLSHFAIYMILNSLNTKIIPFETLEKTYSIMKHILMNTSEVLTREDITGYRDEKSKHLIFGIPSEKQPDGNIYFRVSGSIDEHNFLEILENETLDTIYIVLEESDDCKCCKKNANYLDDVGVHRVTLRNILTNDACFNRFCEVWKYNL